eukprot:2534201-Pleurochrysis_carterae.AAC.1
MRNVKALDALDLPENGRAALGRRLRCLGRAVAKPALPHHHAHTLLERPRPARRVPSTLVPAAAITRGRVGYYPRGVAVWLGVDCCPLEQRRQLQHPHPHLHEARRELGGRAGADHCRRPRECQEAALRACREERRRECEPRLLASRGGDGVCDNICLVPPPAEPLHDISLPTRWCTTHKVRNRRGLVRPVAAPASNLTSAGPVPAAGKTPGCDGDSLIW